MIPQRDDGAPEHGTAPDHVPAALVRRYGEDARERVEWSRLVASFDAGASLRRRVFWSRVVRSRATNTVLLVIAALVGVGALAVPVITAAPFPVVAVGALTGVGSSLVLLALIRRGRW